MKLLVINADDFGYSNERNKGIVQCFNQSCVTSVSLMVNGVATREAVSISLKHNIPTGLHVNITEGRPLLEKQCSTLTDENGLFLGKLGIRRAVADGRISLNEVRDEIQAQIDSYRTLMGGNPGHADGHQHIHVIPELCGTFAAVLQENNIQVSRLPIEPSIEGHHWLNSNQSHFMKEVVHQAQLAKDVFSEHNIWCTDRFIGLKTMGADMTVSRVKNEISSVFSTASLATNKDDFVTCEWMVHPGYATKADGGCGAGPDDFSRSPDREHEMSVLCSSDIKSHLQTLSVQLVNFNTCIQTLR